MFPEESPNGNYIVKGGTPCFRFKIPKTIDLSTIVKVRITILSLTGVLEKGIEDTEIDLENNIILLNLTQAETLNLGVGEGEVQLKLKDASGIVYPSLATTIDICKSLDNKEL